MRIKEAAARCGLTEKAIRLYEEKGMITPAMTEINGRRFRDYDGETIHSLETIAGLRKAFFTMEQIAEMQNSPANTPEVFREYRKELHERWAQLGELIARADAIDPAALDSPDVLADALMSNRPENLCSVAGQPILTEEAKAAPPPPPKETVGIWDEDLNRDARELVYRKYFADRTRWEKRYAAELFIGRILDGVKPHLKWAVPLILVLTVSAWVVCTQPRVTDVDLTMEGQEIWLPDDYEAGCQPVSSSPVTLTLSGKRYDYLFKPDYYEGQVSIDGWIPVQQVKRESDLSPEEELAYLSNCRIMLDSEKPILSFLNSLAHSALYTRIDGTDILNVIIPEPELSGVAMFISELKKSETGSKTYSSGNGYLIFPAKDVQDAADYFREKIWPVWISPSHTESEV